MNNLKKVFALFLIVATILSFAGCHKKNEIAVTVNDVEFTSAYYMCAFVMADGEARTKVDANASDTDKEIDYFSKKIDGKKYAEWVKDTALDNIKKIAAYKIKCDEAKIKLGDDDKTDAETYASYYWYNYGYQALLEPNGVAFTTYQKYMVDAAYANYYFEHIYGKGGEKEIAVADISKAMYENFEVANLLEGSYADLDEAAIENLDKKFDNYLKQLKEGKKSFEEIYKEYNNIKDEEKDEHNHDGEEKELEPQDKYASIIGSEDTTYASDHFKTVQKMKVGEIKLVKLEDDAGIAILVKKDIKADPYYAENLDLVVRHLLKDDEFEKAIDEFIKTLKVKEDTYATGQFKVKKIKYPETQQ